MKHIHDMMLLGNMSDAISELYKLPLRHYPRLIHYCALNPDFGQWVAVKLEMILDDTTYTIKACGDKRQFRCVEEAVGRLNQNQPTASMLRLTYGAKKRTNRLIRRSAKLSGQMLMNHGICGLDKLIDACNTGLEDD